MVCVSGTILISLNKISESSIMSKTKNDRRIDLTLILFDSILFYQMSL